MLEASGFDFALAGARLLAKDAAAIATPNTTECVLALLQDPQSMKIFRTQVVRRQIRLDDGDEDSSEQLLQVFVEEFVGRTS